MGALFIDILDMKFVLQNHSVRINVHATLVWFVNDMLHNHCMYLFFILYSKCGICEATKKSKELSMTKDFQSFYWYSQLHPNLYHINSKWCRPIFFHVRSLQIRISSSIILALITNSLKKKIHLASIEAWKITPKYWTLIK